MSNLNNNQPIAEQVKTNDAVAKLDRMRYNKNKASANLALLSIVFNALYFVCVYKTDVGTYFYKIMIGASVLYNLVFMLIAFLSSESVKNYKFSYAIVMLVLGALQIVRIFYIPLNALRAVHGEYTVINAGKFALMTVYLSLSAAALFAGGVIGIIRSKKLKNFQQAIESEKANA